MYAHLNQYYVGAGWGASKIPVKYRLRFFTEHLRNVGGQCRCPHQTPPGLSGLIINWLGPQDVGLWPFAVSDTLYLGEDPSPQQKTIH